MSWSERIELDCVLSASALLEHINPYCELEINPVKRMEMMAGNWVECADANTEAWSINVQPGENNLVRDALGFRSKIGMKFDFHKFKFDIGNPEMFKIVMGILHQTDWDMVYMAGDVPLLMRKGGQITVQRQYEGYWAREQLDQIKLPYTLEEIPIP